MMSSVGRLSPSFDGSWRQTILSCLQKIISRNVSSGLGRSPVKSLALLALALAFALAGLAARAQAADPVDLEAARREKSLSWYTSTPVAQAQQLASTFEQQTRVKVQLLRSGGQAVLRRLQQELSAGRPGADVLTMSDAGAANGLARQGILEPFRPEGFAQVVDGAKDRDGRWIAQRLQLVGIPIRT